MTLPEAVERLRRVRAACAGGQPLHDADAAWLADALAGWERQARDGCTLDEALGLAPLPGRESWPRTEARGRRDEALRRLAETEFHGLPVARQAAEIAKLARRYETSAWRSERHLAHLPVAHRGRNGRALLWAAFRAGSVPMSARQLERILRRQEGAAQN